MPEVRKVFEGKVSSLDPANVTVTCNGSPLLFPSELAQPDRRIGWGANDKATANLVNMLAVALFNGTNDVVTEVLTRVFLGLPANAPWCIFDYDLIKLIREEAMKRQ